MMTSVAQVGGDPNDLADKILEHSNWRFLAVFMPFLRDTHKVGLPPDRPVCAAELSGHCLNGTACPDRHVASSNWTRAQGPNSLVCKHWLRGLCKKGDQCEFLHEYNRRKMPECNFFARNGYCSNGEECLYLHVDPLSRLPPCPNYKRGFCPLGPRCPKKHVFKRMHQQICPYYLAGFCPIGPLCRKGPHPKWGKGNESGSEHGYQAAKTDKAEEEEDANKGRTQSGEREESRERDRDGGRGGRDRDDSRARHGRGRWRKGDRRFRGRPGGH